MKHLGEIGIFNDKGIGEVKIIPPGNYTLGSIGKKLQELFNEEGIEIKLDDANGLIVIENPQNRKIMFDRDLTFLSFLFSLNAGFVKENTRTRLTTQTTLRLVSFNNYFIHCDLLDKDGNLFNGKPSTLLACFDTVGKSFERVEYSPKEIVMKKNNKWKIYSFNENIRDG